MTEHLHGISGSDNRAQQKHMSSAQDVCESKEPMQRSAATADYVEDPFAYTNNSADECPAPYVRPTKPHHTQEAINDLQEDEVDNLDVTGIDSRTIKSSSLKRRQRRISRKDAEILNKSQYGHYLEIPRNKRSIFQPQQRIQQQRMNKLLFLSALIVVAIVIVLFYIIH